MQNGSMERWSSIKWPLWNEVTHSILFSDIQNRPSYAFSALWVDNTDANPNDALRFTRVNLNDHDVYDRNTGAFKTPVDGTYTFTAYVCVYNGEHLYLQFLADDAIIGAFNTGDRYSIACTASTAMSQLLKGQIVKLIVVKRTSSGNIIYNDDKGFLNSFSGMLIK